jgi:hypothetical protein
MTGFAKATVSLTRHLLADAISGAKTERKDDQIDNYVWHVPVLATSTVALASRMDSRSGHCAYNARLPNPLKNNAIPIVKALKITIVASDPTVVFSTSGCT